MLWCRLVEGWFGGCSGKVWGGGLETGKGRRSGAWSREVAWRAGQGKRRGGRSTGILWMLLKELFGSWSSKLVSKLVEGSGLDTGGGKWSLASRKTKSGIPPQKKINNFFLLHPRPRTASSRQFLSGPAPVSKASRPRQAAQ